VTIRLGALERVPEHGFVILFGTAGTEARRDHPAIFTLGDVDTHHCTRMEADGVSLCSYFPIDVGCWTE
jgi:hypothetical protein